MNKVIIALVCLVFVQASIKEEMAPIIEHVNSVGTTWVAGHNERQEGFTLADVAKLCGAYPEDVHSKLPQKEHFSMDIPATFDARTAWPNCESVQEVRDQSACGSCWAFGAVEAMSDRLCIASGQTDQTRISSQDLLTCCSSCGNGCNGGFPSGAWQYYESTGLVSGGLYGDSKYCQAYSMPPCAHHVHSEKYPDCPSDYDTPSCSEQCSQSSGLTWNSDLHHGGSSYSVQGVENIQKEIMTNGPVECAFTVYADFEAYKSGVYQHTTGSYLGGHAVKMLGWGTEDGVDYWLIANSWNESWGMDGFFKIKRGTNECGIEDSIVAGPAPSKLFLSQ